MQAFIPEECMELEIYRIIEEIKQKILNLN